MRSRAQIGLLVLTLLILTGLIVAGVAAFMQRPSELTMVAGQPNSPERRFAERLSQQLEQKQASVRIRLINPDMGESSSSRFARDHVDLAVIRTDARIPSHARSVAVLEHELLLILAQNTTVMSGVADLRGKRLAVLGEDGRNETLIRQILDQYGIDAGSTPLRTVPSGSHIDELLSPGRFDFVLAFKPTSEITTSRDFSTLASRMNGFALFGLTEGDAMERKLSGIYAEPIEAGLLSGAPSIPPEDIGTIAVLKILMARDDVRDHDVAELMRFIFSNKADLRVEGRFATHIEPPDTDQDSPIPAHEGAAEYIDSDVQSFFERYSDLIYLVMSVGSVVGSVGLAAFTAATRVKPVKAGERAHDMMTLLDKIRAAEDSTQLEIVETELEDVLKEVLRGLKDGTVSSDGLDAFRMGYEHAREALALRRRASGGTTKLPLKI